jgi:hypothetical protein
MSRNAEAKKHGAKGRLGEKTNYNNTLVWTTLKSIGIRNVRAY